MLRSQRGVSSLLFAGSMVGVLGAVGLGTEVGSWYLARRHGQNAADAAAMAGALMLASTSSTQAVQAASSGIAGSNGYSSGVTIYTPPQSGSYAGNASAVQVVISQAVTPRFMALFIQPFSISTSAVATLVPNAPVCVLALGNGNSTGIALTGNGRINAPNCATASNNTSSNAITGGGNASATVTELVTSGGCSQTGNSRICSGNSVKTYQPATSDPFAAAQAVPVPSFGTASCINANTAGSSANGSSALTPYANSQGLVTGKAYCNGTVSFTDNSTGILAPGTYYFYNASLSLSSNATVSCPQCTNGQGVLLVFVGSSPGTISISGNGRLTLQAPTINNYNSAFDGLLIYSPTTSNVTFSGNANATLSGGLYYPNASVTYTGNGSGTAPSSCSFLIANSVTFSGNGSFDVSSCPSIAPQTRSAQLVG